VVSQSREEAANHFGWMAMFFGMDGPASCEKTEKELGWRAAKPGLLADMERSYFEAREEVIAV
jgi:hypothetical protein